MYWGIHYCIQTAFVQIFSSFLHNCKPTFSRFFTKTHYFQLHLHILLTNSSTGMLQNYIKIQDYTVSQKSSHHLIVCNFVKS